MGKYTAARYLDSGNKTNWYVVASRTLAVIYVDGADHRFHVLDRIENPEGYLTETELTSDRPGRGFSSAGGGVIHHSLDRRSTKHEHAAIRFARRIGQVLERAQREQRYEGLVLVAEPHFLGLLRDALPSAVEHAVKHEVRHEYCEGSDDEIRAQILNAIERQRESHAAT